MMSKIQKGHLLNVNQSGTRVDNAIALQDGPLPIKAYNQTKGIINVDESYAVVKLDDKFPDFVETVLDRFRDELGTEVWEEIKKESMSQSKDIVENLIDNYFNYLIENYDKAEAAQQAIQDTGIDIMIDHSSTLVSILVDILISAAG